jgi:hypothetical protein
LGHCGDRLSRGRRVPDHAAVVKILILSLPLVLWILISIANG